MTLRMKLLLGFLAAAAVLNGVADLWFRLGITTATGSPWYVWAPVALTAILVVGTIVGGYVVKRLHQGAAESAEELAPEQRVVVVLPLGKPLLTAADYEAMIPTAVGELPDPDAWRHDDGFMPPPRLRKGVWEHEFYFTRAGAA